MLNRMTNEAKILTGIVVITVVLVVGAVFFLSQPEKPVIIDAANLVKDDALKIASDGAKLTIVEFGDYQCPACKLAHPGLKQVVAEHPGQVNFIFRNYPLPMHANAQPAAKAVEAAAMQGKGWEMHDKLYESQDEWANQSNPLAMFKQYATELGIDAEKMESDMNSSTVNDKISRDIADGNTSGVNATPTLFLNNEFYKGGIGYSDLKAAVEAKLQ